MALTEEIYSLRGKLQERLKLLQGTSFGTNTLRLKSNQLMRETEKLIATAAAPPKNLSKLGELDILGRLKAKLQELDEFVDKYARSRPSGTS